MTLRMTQAEVDAHKRRMAGWVNEPSLPYKVEHGVLSTTLDIRLKSTANQRAHPIRVWRQGKAHAKAVAFGVPKNMLPRLPVVVTITRVGHRTLDTDNLAISAKAVRDAIALLYGVVDGDPLYTWEYAQEKSAPRVHACRITVRPR